jgi:hypothetical protein
MAQPSRRVTLSIQNIQNGNPSEKLNGFFYNNLVNDKLTDPGIWNNQPLPETNENSYNIQTKDYVPAKNTIPAQCIYVNNSTRDVKTIEISGDWNSNSDQPTPQ